MLTPTQTPAAPAVATPTTSSGIDMSQMAQMMSSAGGGGGGNDSGGGGGGDGIGGMLGGIEEKLSPGLPKETRGSNTLGGLMKLGDPKAQDAAFLGPPADSLNPNPTAPPMRADKVFNTAALSQNTAVPGAESGGIDPAPWDSLPRSNYVEKIPGAGGSNNPLDTSQGIFDKIRNADWNKIGNNVMKGIEYGSKLAGGGGRAQQAPAAPIPTSSRGNSTPAQPGTIGRSKFTMRPSSLSQYLFGQSRV